MHLLLPDLKKFNLFQFYIFYILYFLWRLCLKKLKLGRRRDKSNNMIRSLSKDFIRRRNRRELNDRTMRYT